MDLPPNSDKSKNASVVDKDVRRVTTGEPKMRKKSLGKQFTSTFIGGDAKTATEYVIFSVLIPAAKDALAEAASQGFEKLIFGESRARRSSAPRPGGSLGHVAYQQYSKAARGPLAAERRPISERARSNHDFGEIVLEHRVEAEEVVDQMFEILGRYNAVTVSDLYQLCGARSTHTDKKWGWDDLTGAGVTKIRGGYLLDLPDPEPLD